jgi:hypothetical protein
MVLLACATKWAWQPAPSIFVLRGELRGYGLQLRVVVHLPSDNQTLQHRRKSR